MRTTLSRGIGSCVLLACAVAQAGRPPVPARSLDVAGAAVRPSPKSNMGFLYHAQLDAVAGFQNVHVVSIPFFDGFSDRADTASPDPCHPAGGTFDGIINADDVLCDWWVSGQGAMSLSRRDDAGERWQTRTAMRDASGNVLFLGGWTAPLVAGEGYLVQVSGPDGGPVQNHVVIVGSFDPAHVQGLALPPSGNPQVSLLNSPPNTMYASFDEMLCGLEGMSWTDLDFDGNPDSCPSGIFDVATGAPMTIWAFDNVPDGSPTDNQWFSRTVERDASGLLVFGGSDHPIESAEIGYLATYAAPFSGTAFLSPHF